MAEQSAASAVQGAAAQTNKGVRTRHPSYDRMLPKWQRCRDVCEGQDAVHDAGERYLKKLKDQSQTDYAAYVLRATFYNATWRTVSGLNGMIFRKPPKVDVPEATKPLLADVTMSGVPLQMFAQSVSEEALKVGRVGVLVDYPSTDGNGLTQADAARLNLRPTMATYRAESIINWRQRTINNRHVLSLVVLCEKQETLVSEFEIASEERYRVLDLFTQVDEKTKTSRTVYRVRVFSINAKGDDILVSESIPLMNNQPLESIPFVFLGVDDITPEVDDPPMIDLVDLNLSHYRTTADYEHGCHFTGLPTAVVSGWSPPTGSDGTVEKLYIGSTTAWIFTDPNAKAAYLEFTGEGLGALKENLDRKEQQMAILGARMLEAQKKSVEAAETASIHRVGEESMLSSVAQTISLGLTRALEWFSAWAGSNGPALIELNRDFFPVPMSPQQITALMGAWQGGAISKETLFENLKQGEVIGQDSTFEDEETKIANAPPQMTGPADPAGAGAA